MATQATKQTPVQTHARGRFGTFATSISSMRDSSQTASREERLRIRAYYLAEAAGFPAGRANDFWYQAEREIV